MTSDIELQKIGQDSLMAFVRTVAEIIRGNSFDYVLTASDSGNLASRITEYIYQESHIRTPPIMALPISRHADKERTIEFDNTVLASQYKQWRNIKSGQCLFVDDEIWHGVTLKGYMDVLNVLGSLPESCTIVAEDGGFVCPETLYGIKMKFIPTKERIPTVYNSFSHTIPKRFINALLPIQFANDKQMMCTLLGLPVKALANGLPTFDDTLIRQSNLRITHFTDIQYEYEQWLRNTIKHYLAG